MSERKHQLLYRVIRFGKRNDIAETAIVMGFCHLSLIQRKLCTSIVILWQVFCYFFSFHFNAGRVFKFLRYISCPPFLMQRWKHHKGLLTNGNAVLPNECNALFWGTGFSSFPSSVTGLLATTWQGCYCMWLHPWGKQ